MHTSRFFLRYSRSSPKHFTQPMTLLSCIYPVPQSLRWSMPYGNTFEMVFLLFPFLSWLTVVKIYISIYTWTVVFFAFL